MPHTFSLIVATQWPVDAKLIESWDHRLLVPLAEIGGGGGQKHIWLYSLLHPQCHACVTPWAHYKTVLNEGGKYWRIGASKWSNSFHEAFPDSSWGFPSSYPHRTLLILLLGYFHLFLLNLEILLSITLNSQREGLLLISYPQKHLSVPSAYCWPADTQVKRSVVQIYRRGQKQGGEGRSTYVLNKLSVLIWSWRSSEWVRQVPASLDNR